MRRRNESRRGVPSGSTARCSRSARVLSDLTHHEVDAGDACVLWSPAIRHAIRTTQIPARIEHGNRVLVRLMDRAGAAENINLDLVLLDAADAVAALRAEGRTVLLHCVQAHSRTPSVGALHAARHLGIPVEQALADVVAALPSASPQRFLRDAVTRLGAQRA